MTRAFKPIYLCGAISGRSDSDAHDWRTIAGSLSRWPVLNPMRHDFRGRELMNVKQIVEGDLRDIQQSWAIVYFFDGQISAGSSMEMFHAYWSNKAVVLVNANKVALTPWMIYHASRIAYDLREAFGHLEKLAAMHPGLDLEPEEPQAPPEQATNESRIDPDSAVEG